MEYQELDSKHRWNTYCRAESKDGRICSLYSDHESEEHVENHGKSRWRDEE